MVKLNKIYTRTGDDGTTGLVDGSRCPKHSARIAAIGSGGNYALSAAKALVDYEDDAETIARKAMAVAADVCVFTNGNVTVERV